jgi:hypothetical protein
MTDTAATASGPGASGVARPHGGTLDAATAVFPGDSEMATRCRGLDWAATPLGPLASWPPSLRTTVGLCLGSGFPTLVMWGPELVQVYNDAFRSVLQAKHPAALGQRACDCWPELWAVIGPMYQGVLDTGAPVFIEDQLFTPARRGDAGAVEEAYFTFSYSAIPGESARPGGILATVYETTRHVQSRGEREAALERSNARLQALAADLQQANEELQSTAEELEERTAAAEVARLATERSEARFALLAQASAALAGSLDYEATLEARCPARRAGAGRLVLRRRARRRGRPPACRGRVRRLARSDRAGRTGGPRAPEPTRVRAPER